MNSFTSFGSHDSGYESGIVEVFECGTSRPQFDQHDYLRDAARQRQHMLAGELSRLDAGEYQQDILDHMMQMDAATLPDVDSIDIQTEIQWYMRPYLLDFLIEAHGAFQLLPETLFLAVNLLDRYCSKRVVYKRHYQLVGCAALLIASKYGDKKEKVPTIKELKSMCCSLYDDDMFMQMEWHVLSTLDWSVGHPTVDSFVKLAIKDGVPDPETEHMTHFVLEIALYHREFVSRKSSTLALAALALSRHVLSRQQARSTEFASGYCEQTLVELSQKLQQPSEILSRKYSSGRYSEVAGSLKQFLDEQAAIQAAAAAAAAAAQAQAEAEAQAQALAEAQAAAAAQVQVQVQGPPSPPRDQLDGACSPYIERYSYSTPHKPRLHLPQPYGYPTPPITPDGEYFGKPSHHVPVPDQCYTPVTPTPSSFPQNCHANQSTWSFESYQGNAYNGLA